MAKRKRKKNGPIMWGLLIVGFLFGALTVLLAVRYTDLIRQPAPPVSVPAPVAPAPALTRPDGQVPPETAFVPAPGPRVAIVIDDMGQDTRQLDGLLEVGSPVTVAVLPHLPHSMDVARRAYKEGLDVLLHLPMEPKDLETNSPGPGALLTMMTSEELRSVMDDDLASVPHAIGINNHMGSRFTEDEEKMHTVLALVKERGLFFLDSRTTSKSVGLKMAKRAGVRSVGRNIFLDNTRDVEYIKGQLDKALRLAVKKGSAVAIGHPYPETIEALQQFVPIIVSSGVLVVRLSEIINEETSPFVSSHHGRETLQP